MKKGLLKEVLNGITPGNEMEKEVEGMLAGINREIKKRRISARALIGGSFSKGTFLKQDHDVDIFVLFSMKHRDDDLSAMLQKALGKFKPERVHGSRDYFKIKNELNYEIVPVLDIRKPEDARNVTDFSPAHVKWVNSNGKKYKGDIRLAKKFCKACGVYGAESYINGFSGHVLDILVIYYKGFTGLARAAAKWGDKQVVDFYRAHKGKALFNLNKSKTEGPLVVIDPVQPDRNASAALAKEKFDRFVKAARAFLKNPSADFFAEKKESADGLRKKGALTVEVDALGGKEDVVGAKILKVFEFLKKGLADFEVSKAGWQWDRNKKALLWFMPNKKELPEMEERAGPPISKKKFAADFRKKYRKTYTKGGRVHAKVKRKHTKPGQMLKELLKSSYVKERVKGARLK